VSVTDYDRADNFCPIFSKRLAWGVITTRTERIRVLPLSTWRSTRTSRKSRAVWRQRTQASMSCSLTACACIEASTGGEGLDLVGQEMPLGATIALLAICAGVKNVAVVTDKNHHYHPASAALDHFRGCKRKASTSCVPIASGTPSSTSQLVGLSMLSSSKRQRASKSTRDRRRMGKRKGLPRSKARTGRRFSMTSSKKLTQSSCSSYQQTSCEILLKLTAVSRSKPAPIRE